MSVNIDKANVLARAIEMTKRKSWRRRHLLTSRSRPAHRRKTLKRHFYTKTKSLNDDLQAQESFGRQAQNAVRIEIRSA